MTPTDNKPNNSIRIPVPLVPVYATLSIQLIAVVFASGVIYTKLDANIRATTNIEVKFEKLGDKVERFFTKSNERMNRLDARVRHFQAQFPDKRILQ